MKHIIGIPISLMQIKTKMTTNLFKEKCVSFILTISLIEFELDIAITLWVNVPDIKKKNWPTSLFSIFNETQPIYIIKEEIIYINFLIMINYYIQKMKRARDQYTLK